MKNKLITAIILIQLAVAGVLGYLYNIEKDKNIILGIENNRANRELAFADSISKVLKNTKIELDSLYKDSEKKNAEINYKLELLEDSLTAVLKKLDNQPIDSIAAYIVLNYLGDTYKVQKINDSTFVAFQEITVRDIAKKTEAFKAQNKRIKLLTEKISNKDTLLKKQATKIGILTHTADTLLQRSIIMNEGFSKCEETVKDLTTEVDKQKGQKRIAIYTAGGLLILLILL